MKKNKTSNTVKYVNLDVWISRNSRLAKQMFFWEIETCFGIFHKSYPFRVGDIVKINNIGGIYRTYRNAFRHFYGNDDFPYYSSVVDDSEIYNKLFKIEKIAAHEFNSSCFLVSLKDMFNRYVVFDADYLTLVKQFPLKKNEVTHLNIDVIPRR